MEQLLQSQGTILRPSDADDKGSLRGIQTVDKGLCMLGDCASKLGTLFDILKDLDDHALENHIKPKKPKKVVDYFTVYPLLERKNKLEQIKIKEEVQVKFNQFKCSFYNSLEVTYQNQKHYTEFV